MSLFSRLFGIDQRIKHRPKPKLEPLGCVEEAVIEEPLSIKDITATLPWHTERKWSKRALSSINKVVVHQSLTSRTKSNFENINNYHITPGPQNHISPNGAPHICYHYGINADGQVCQFNKLYTNVWHCKGQNSTSIGILMLGNFYGPTYVGEEVSPTEAQLSSLEKLLDFLVDEEGADESPVNVEKKQIFGHSSFGKENCPGLAIDKFITAYKETA